MDWFLIAAVVIAAPQASQADLNDKTGSDFAHADIAMNRQYRVNMAAMARMDSIDAPDARSGPTYRTALVASQRAWLRFRDAECLMEGYYFRGGSAQGMAVSDCKATVTRARTAQLRSAGK